MILKDFVMNIIKVLSNLIIDYMMNKSLNKKRLDYIDIAKSFGMFTIILGAYHSLWMVKPNSICLSHTFIFFIGYGF